MTCLFSPVIADGLYRVLIAEGCTCEFLILATPSDAICGRGAHMRCATSPSLVIH